MLYAAISLRSAIFGQWVLFDWVYVAILCIMVLAVFRIGKNREVTAFCVNAIKMQELIKAGVILRDEKHGIVAKDMPRAIMKV